MKTGMRVKVRWRAERVGEIKDIACFTPDPFTPDPFTPKKGEPEGSHK
jgi:hypothetical protein